MMAGTLTALAWPFLRKRAETAVDPEMLVYQDQLAETDRDVERGLLTEDEAGNLRAEISRRMERLQKERDSTASSPAKASAHNMDLVAVAMVSVVLLAGSLGVYFSLGSPDKRDLPLSARSIAPTGGSSEGAAAQSGQGMELSRLADNLAKKMQERPDNLDGWMLLGRTYMTLEKWRPAASAFARAHTLSPRGPDIAASYAEALYMAGGRTFDVQSKSVLQAALRADPRDLKSLFYWGLLQALDDQHAPALQTWTNLRAISPPGAPWLTILERRMRETAQAGGINPAAVKPTLQPQKPAQVPMAKPSEAAPRGPTQEDVKAAQEMTATDRMAFIRSMVEGLASRLEDNPNDLAGWKRLARAYRVLGETKKAEDAEKRIRALENSAK